MPKSLIAFDTATGGISIGAMSTAGDIATRVLETQRDQASLLVPLILEAMDEINLSFDDLDGVATTKGPGSFTGLRIGLSAARTFGVSLGVPVLGMNTLDVMAAHYTPNTPYLIVLETKRRDFYARFYDENGAFISDSFAEEIGAIFDKMPEGITTVGGDCLERFKSEVGDVSFTYLDEIKQPDPKVLLRVAQQELEALGGEMLERPKPLYLRGADVSVAKVPPRQLAKASE